MGDISSSSLQPYLSHASCSTVEEIFSTGRGVKTKFGEALEGKKWDKGTYVLYIQWLWNRTVPLNISPPPPFLFLRRYTEEIPALAQALWPWLWLSHLSVLLLRIHVHVSFLQFSIRTPNIPLPTFFSLSLYLSFILFSFLSAFHSTTRPHTRLHSTRLLECCCCCCQRI